MFHINLEITHLNRWCCDGIVGQEEIFIVGKVVVNLVDVLLALGAPARTTSVDVIGWRGWTFPRSIFELDITAAFAATPALLFVHEL